LLTEKEEPYIDYLRIKGIKMTKHENELVEKRLDVEDIRGILKTDKDLIDKSVKAYVSYIRYYNEHELSYLFQLKNLDIGDTANAFGLFYIPTMKELRGKDISSFKKSIEQININAIPYKDKNKEKQRDIINEE
jgi:ATP-dependent RNA helicase DDX55/SPB4